MEAPAIVDLIGQLVPLTIRHAELDLVWSVLELLEVWTTPDFEEDLRSSMELKRYRVRVTGPLSGHPSETGEFTMIVRRLGDSPSWWAGPGAEVGRSSRARLFH